MTNREAFEQWYRQYYGHLTDSRTGDRYDYAPVQRAYEGWQASRNQALDEAAARIEGGHFLHEEAPDARLARSAAKAIRELKSAR